MGGGGNITYTKQLKEETRCAMIQNIPLGLWKRARQKSIELDRPVKEIYVKLLEKWVKGEVEV